MCVCSFQQRDTKDNRKNGKRGLKTRVGDRKDTVREINGGNESSGKKQCSQRAHDEWKI